MYNDLFNKISRHFSDIGSLIYSQACDFFKLHPISIDDIKAYYEILCSDAVIPQNINRKNHKICCLFYLSKDNPNYRDIFVENFLKTIKIKNIEINAENLVMTFNVIEFEKTYVDSSKDQYKFLYNLLTKFNYFETEYKNIIIYKYCKGYFQMRLGDLNEAIKEYSEIIKGIAVNEDFIIKYIKLKCKELIAKINELNNTPKINKNINNYIPCNLKINLLTLIIIFMNLK